MVGLHVIPPVLDGAAVLRSVGQAAGEGEAPELHVPAAT